MKILTFGASTSKHSINKALARHAAEQLQAQFFPEAKITVLDLNDFEMPLFSVDREAEGGIPEPAKRFYAEIGSADALVVSFAEHNGSYAAAFKNLFDWTTRFEGDLFQKKPTVFLATSPGERGANQVLQSALTRATRHAGNVVASVSVPSFSDVFSVDDGVLHDADLAKALHAALTTLARTIAPERFPAAPAGPRPGPEMWDGRYAETYASYGTAPNTFLKSVAGRIPDGPVLVIAAGEGRDAVYLAERGHDVTAMDQSAQGMANAQTLATERGVKLTTEVADLATYAFGESHWAGIVSVWAHVPPALRQQVHAAAAKALKPGGVFVLEAYAPAHLKRPGKGGPPVAAMLMTPETVRAELPGLSCEVCQQVERNVDEGKYHQGPSTTTQVVAVRST